MLAERARHWALALTRQPSVTGSEEERAFGPWLANELSRTPAFAGRPEIWTIPVAEGDGRSCVAMLLRGSGAATVLLTGHFDTVSIDDYGDLRALATDPEPLAAALRLRLTDHARSHAERRARSDLDGADFLPGRGLLDMKAGLAAGLAVAETFAARHAAAGNILFLAVPDEENNSAGARAAAPLLEGLARERGLEIVAAINLDSIADDGAGEKGRVIALGTVGKLLPTAFVAGVPSHSGFPLNGINAVGLAAAIAARVEWAPDLTDQAADGSGTPPSLLSLRDGKAGYDVTTPASAFATFNVLTYRRSPAEVLDRFDRLCAEAASAHLAELRKRSGAAGDRQLPEAVPVHRYEAVLAAARERDPAHAAQLAEFGASLAQGGHSLPEQCRIMTERAWALSGLAAPAVVLGFGSIPYPPTNLSERPGAARLREIAGTLAAQSEARYGERVTCTDYFAGISDMSFLGEADESGLATVARNTPLWLSLRWPDRDGVPSGAVAAIPTINIGPWGRDYHTPLERMHVGYGFEVLPRLLADVVGALLGAGEAEPGGG